MAKDAADAEEEAKASELRIRRPPRDESPVPLRGLGIFFAPDLPCRGTVTLLLHTCRRFGPSCPALRRLTVFVTTPLLEQ
jgi:hypothetical protein